jgi:predicted  nucleic acid-binding Zn-ribbon protein
MTPFAATIPESLMQKLHDAMDRFHAAREELERSMSASDYRHQQRVDQAGDRLQQVERELEQIDEAIKGTLRADPSGGAGHH